MNERKKSSGVSLLEIVVSMIILALVMAGLFNVFVAGRGYLIHSRCRTSASQFATKIMDPLQNEVNQSTWDTAGNRLIVGSPPDTTEDINGVTYNSNFMVTDQSAGSFLRRVVLNVTWNETKP